MAPTQQAPSTVLAINGGSSSVKFALFGAQTPPQRLLSGQIERVGQASSVLTIKQATGEKGQPQPIEARDPAQAAEQLAGWLQQQGHLAGLVGIGHRIVHGGPKLDRPHRITAEVLAELRRITPIDPEHLPGEIALIDSLARRLPNHPQVACFDTAFFRELPRVSRLLALPRSYEEQGVRRYGFHGLSYTFLLEDLERRAGQSAAQGRIILAHLGAGASLTAVHQGKPIDTTMGFTPTGGIPMGTRSGDLDPGVLIYLLRSGGLTVDALDKLVNHQSGLRGVSGMSGDVRDLLEQEKNDGRAAEALEMFCYQARKAIGSFVAALGGIDTLVFSGGIGEHAAVIRDRICRGLTALGLELDAARNEAGQEVISTDGSPATIRVLPTDEETVIARQTLEVLA
jgi:acetate kinase